MSWRKILSLFSACSGLFFSVSILFLSDDHLSLAVSSVQYALVVLGVLGFANAIPLWFGRVWALWLLRVIAGLALVAVGALSVEDYLASGESIDGWSFLGQAAFYASLLTIPGFFVAILFQPSVVAEFGQETRAAA